MRLTGGQYLCAGSTAPGNAASLARVRAGPLVERPRRRPGAGAWRSGLSLDRPLPSLDRVDLLADGDHRVAEPVELGEVLGLGGLDHQRARDGERHRGRVEAVVDEPLGDVVDGDAGGLR